MAAGVRAAPGQRNKKTPPGVSPGRCSLTEVGQQILSFDLTTLSSLGGDRAAHLSHRRDRRLDGRRAVGARVASRLAAAVASVASGLAAAVAGVASGLAAAIAAAVPVATLLGCMAGLEEVPDRRALLAAARATARSSFAARLAAASTGVASGLAAAVAGVTSGLAASVPSVAAGLAAASTGVAAGLTARLAALAAEHPIEELETEGLATNGHAENQRTEEQHTLHRATSPLLVDHCGVRPARDAVTRGCDPRTFFLRQACRAIP